MDRPTMDDDFFKSSESSVKQRIESFADELEPISLAIPKSIEFGCPAISAGVGSLLRTLCTTIAAKHVVDVGTGVGISAAWLSLGLAEDGTITSIDIESEYQKSAKELLNIIGVNSNQVRLLAGRANLVLSKLTDNGYDLVFVDVNQFDASALLEDAVRLIRNNGLLIVHGVLSARENSAKLLTELIHESDDFDSSIIPLGQGLVVAARKS
jgi:predicted O-methyltransferase YrrM